MVVPLTPAGKLILVQQFRYLGNRNSLEFPCGGVKPEHNHLQTAQFELAEEAGRKAAQLELIGAFNPWNGAAKETCQLYLATGLEVVQAEADPTEDIDCFEYSPAELDHLIQQGQIWDGMTLAAWLLARDRVQKCLANPS
jgi:ADP-ribose pyrophosphatase